MIKPPGGVRAFFAKFGTKRRAQDAANSMGVKISLSQIRSWMDCDLMPEHIFSALSALIIQDEETVPGRSIVEVYFKEKPMGRLFLHRDCTLKVLRSKK